jgi:phenylacetate-CoA ligase
MMFEPRYESLPRPEMKSLQSQRLAEVSRYVYERVDFYRHKLDEAGVEPDDISSLNDLRRLPFTRKEELRDHYPFGLFAVPMEDVVRVHASSGTTGKPTVVGYTKEDVDVFATVNARCLAMAGADSSMMLHNAYGYGLFTGGLGLHYGGEKLGMTVIPVSGGMTERQIMLITDFEPEVICCTPSYALTLAQEFAERGIEPDDLSLRYAVLGAEPWTDSMRKDIDAGLGVRCTNIYGLSEVIGPGVSNECVEVRDGSHVNEDHFLIEAVDPDTHEPVPQGTEGVIVFTTLTKKALPLLRYWTGDLAALNREPCRCGRTLTRMSLIRGRTDDMLIIRGINVYPTQIGEVLGRIDRLSPHYQLVVRRQGTLDELEIQVEVRQDAYPEMVDGTDTKDAETHRLLGELRSNVEAMVKDIVGVSCTAKLMAPGSMPRSEGGKLARVRDERHLA